MRIHSPLPVSGRSWGRGPRWMTTTIPETLIWGKTPETHTPVWLACQGRPSQHEHAWQANDNAKQE